MKKGTRVEWHPWADDQKPNSIERNQKPGTVVKVTRQGLVMVQWDDYKDGDIKACDPLWLKEL